MSYKKEIIILSGVSLFFIILGYILSTAENYGICSTRSCPRELFFLFGQPLLAFFIPIFLVLIFLFFLNKDILRIWKLFAIFFVPTEIILTYLFIPTYCTNTLLCLEKMTISRLFGIIFLFISFVIIVTKAILIRRKKISI